MAFAAFDRAMFAPQNVPRQGMVERFRFQPPDGELSPVVLLVAVDTQLISVSTMKSCPRIKPSPDFSVTGKTSIAGDRLAKSVTLRAIGDPFKIGVRS